MFSLRLTSAVAAALCVAGQLCAAETTSAAAAGSPALPAVLAPPLKWSTSISLQAAGGFKDNLLLSSVEPERSGFARVGLEAFFWHLPRGNTDYWASLSAEETRYFSGQSIDREANAFAQFEWRYQVEDKMRFAFDVLGYFQEGILDVSDTDVSRQVAELKVVGADAGPTFRWSPRPWGWIEVRASGRRENYHDGSYNGKIGESGARIGWRPVSRLELSVGAKDRRRRFDHREQYSLGGEALEGTLLVFADREKEARLDITWDKDSRWQTTTRATRLERSDNGTGYFDYEERALAQTLEWKGERWRVTLEGTASRIEFPNQTVGRGLTPPIRYADEYSAEMRVERELSPRWTVYAGFNWERNRSNETIASYRVNEGLLGARWSWEK